MSCAIVQVLSNAVQRRGACLMLRRTLGDVWTSSRMDRSFWSDEIFPLLQFLLQFLARNRTVVQLLQIRLCLDPAPRTINLHLGAVVSERTCRGEQPYAI